LVPFVVLDGLVPLVVLAVFALLLNAGSLI
jgi:hypothetical protein